MLVFVQVYYYNARTRESAWAKPEGVKVIQQAELTPLMMGQATGVTSNSPGPSNNLSAAASSNVHTTQASSTVMSSTSTPSTNVVSPLLPTPGTGRYHLRQTHTILLFFLICASGSVFLRSTM